jgi:DNA-binding XRE family transcriptional regulator
MAKGSDRAAQGKRSTQDGVALKPPAGATESPHSARHELVRLRAELGMTQHELAELTGVEESELAAMEAGTMPVTHELLAEIMEELNAKGA